jgi:uncharacterized membrane protein YkvA (DUF1232 family)
MAKVSKKKAEDALRKGAAKVTHIDLDKVIEKHDEIERRFSAKGPLGRYIADFKILFSLVQDYANGKYRTIPFWSIAAVVATLIYVLSPVDLIPDFIPVFGLTDDALVVALCLRMIEEDLHRYKDWKVKNS